MCFKRLARQTLTGLQHKRALVWLLALSGLLIFFGWGVTIYPHSALQPAGASLQAPSPAHWLGTDDLGIDVYAQLSRGFFTSLFLGLGAAVLAFFLGGILGILAGYAGGRLDAGLSFIMHVFLSVPQLPVMIAIGAFFGQSRWHVMLIIGLFSWAAVAKLLRSKTIQLKQQPFLLLARRFGGRFIYLARYHLLPDLMPLLLISVLSVVSRAIIMEASLAYLGLSDPLTRSWGLMINKATAFSGLYFTDYWQWWLLPPVLSLMVTVLILRLFARELEKRWVIRA